MPKAEVEDESTSRAIHDRPNHQHLAVNRAQVTDEDSRRICRKIDSRILPILVWAYFLQVLGKNVVSHSTMLGLDIDLALTDNQFYWVVTIVLISQVAWLPLSSFLIVKMPPKTLLPAMLLGFGIVQACTSATHNFPELMAVRALLSVFEAGFLPLFAIIIGAWYRRVEQPIRIAAWYRTNGLATMIAPLLAYGFGKIQQPHLAPWRIIILSTGLIMILTSPIAYWKIDNDIQTASFLTKDEQAIAVERLRANQAGSDSREARWSQVKESFTDVKTYLFFIMAFLNSIGSQVPYTFGPLVLRRLGFDQYMTLLLNIPFGALEYIVVICLSWLSMIFRWKSLTLGSALVPVIIGLVVLLVLPENSMRTALFLIGYHLFAFILGCNSLIVTWIIANTAGQMKKSVTLSLYSAASSIGSISGPLLLRSSDAPRHETVLKIMLGAYVALFWAVIIQVVNLVLLNRAQEKSRVTHGKPVKIHDHSVEEKYVDIADNNGYCIGNFAFADLTDKQNNEFVYVY